MTAFTYRMPAGIPGDITRKDSAIVEPNIIDEDTPPTVYGNPVKIVDGLVQPIESGDIAADVYGLLVRPFPTNSSQDPLGTSTPPESGPCDVLKLGYMSVKLNNTTAAAKGAAVYVRVADGTVDHPIGGIEAAADGGDCVALAKAYFTGAADESGNVEVAFNL